MKLALRRPPNVRRTIVKTLAATACVHLLKDLAGQTFELAWWPGEFELMK